MPEEAEKVHIVCRNPAIDVHVLMGDGAANLPGAGLGGWTSTSVIDDEALSTWEGQTQLAQDLPLMLDGWGMDPKPVQGALNTLMKLALPRPNSPVPSPPVFQVFGPVHFPGRSWVLPEGGIELSTDEDEVMRDGNGTLLRQALTLHMVAYNRNSGKKPKPKRVPIGDPAKTGGTAFPGNHYVTRKGDTLQSVATDIYGEWQAWKTIAEKNPNLPKNPATPLPLGIGLVL